MEWFRKILARLNGQIYIDPYYRKKWNRERANSNIGSKLMSECPGWDDPDSRCPRKPKNCLCWKYR